MILWTFFNVLLPLTPIVLTLVALVRLRPSGAERFSTITLGRLLGDGILYFLTVVLSLSLAAKAISAGQPATDGEKMVEAAVRPDVAFTAAFIAVVIFAAALLCYYFAIEDRHNPDTGDGGFHAVVSLVLAACAAVAVIGFRSWYGLW